MRKLLLVLILLLLTALMFAGGQQSGEETGEQITIRFAHHNAVDSPLDKAAQLFKELVESDTKGRVEVKVFPAGQLGDAKQNLEGIKLGTIQMALSDPDNISNLVPEFALFALPYMFNDWDHVERVMDSDVAEGLNKNLINSQGIRVIAWMHNGFRDMTTKDKPISSMADFSGLKFRSPGIPVYVKMFEAIGATPTPIPWTEVYTAMKSNIVDGMETTPEGMIGAKIYEVSKYVIKTGHIYTGTNIVISESFYTGLDDESRDAVDKAAAEVTQFQRNLMREANAKAYDQLKGFGMTIIDSLEKDELRKACAPVWKELSASMSDPDSYISAIQAQL